LGQLVKQASALTHERRHASPQIVTSDQRTSRALRKGNHFSIQCIVFPTGCTEKLGANDQRAVSQQ